MKKVRGGQPLTWQKTLQKDLKLIGQNLQSAVNISQDRDLYHTQIVARVIDEAQQQISPNTDEM